MPYPTGLGRPGSGQGHLAAEPCGFGPWRSFTANTCRLRPPVGRDPPRDESRAPPEAPAHAQRGAGQTHVGRAVRPATLARQVGKAPSAEGMIDSSCSGNRFAVESANGNGDKIVIAPGSNPLLSIRSTISAFSIRGASCFDGARCLRTFGPSPVPHTRVSRKLEHTDLSGFPRMRRSPPPGLADRPEPCDRAAY